MDCTTWVACTLDTPWVVIVTKLAVFAFGSDVVVFTSTGTSGVTAWGDRSFSGAATT